MVHDTFVWENAKMVDFSDCVEVYGVKVSIYSKLNQYMETYMYQRSRSFFDLCPRSLKISLISNSFCPEATGQIEVKSYIKSS